MLRNFAIVTAFICSGALAQAPARGVTSVGDVHVYVGHNKADKSSYEETVTVTEVSNGQYKTRHTRDNRPEVYEGLYDKDWSTALSGSSGSKFEPPSKVLDFPLEPGKQWKHSYKMTTRAGGVGTADMETRIVGAEKIKTPAGEFDTVRVDAKGYIGFGSGPGRGGFHLTQSVWYAPSIDRLVRFESKEQRTLGNDILIELKSFKPGR